jgi:hypothetical protein
MALKSKEWFYKQCLHEVKDFSPFAHLCWDILEKGMGQKDSTRGHVTQAIGATQRFLEKYENWQETIRRADPTEPFNIASNPKMLSDWKSWLSSKNGTNGRKAFGFKYGTLKRILTPALGGKCRGGGGGNDEFKRVLRLVVVFAGRK